MGGGGVHESICGASDTHEIVSVEASTAEFSACFLLLVPQDADVTQNGTHGVSPALLRLAPCVVVVGGKGPTQGAAVCAVLSRFLHAVESSAHTPDGQQPPRSYVMVWHAAKTACHAVSARGRRSSKPAVTVILQITRTQNAAHSFGSGDATINALLRSRTINSNRWLVYMYTVQIV